MYSYNTYMDSLTSLPPKINFKNLLLRVCLGITIPHRCQCVWDQGKSNFLISLIILSVKITEEGGTKVYGCCLT